jgi:N-acetylmuramoyl-L-alanine amidase-like protein
MERLIDASPHSVGPFAWGEPSFLLMHGTRSGLDRSIREEFDSNRRYVVTNTKGYSWHVTIGEDAYSMHLPLDKWGWHANEESRQSLGVEFAQPTVDHTINDAQVRAFADWFKVAVATWPGLNIGTASGMRMHSAVASGVRQGKTDVYPLGDPRWPELRGRIIQALGGYGQPGTGADPHDHVIQVPPADDPTTILERYLERLDPTIRQALGDARYRGLLRGKSHWGQGEIHVLRLRYALLGVVDGQVVNLTGHTLDDWQLDHADLIQRF